MKYEIQIEKRAKKFIASQDPKQRERIIKAISLLPVSGDIKPLKGSDNFFQTASRQHKNTLYVKT